MNTLPENLLRDTLTEAAETVAQHSLRPLSATVRRRRHWAIPTGLVAATTLAAAVFVATDQPGARAPAPPVTAPPMTLAAYTGVHFTVVAGGPGGGVPTIVMDAATNRRIANVPTPRGTDGFWDVATTGDDRSYLLTTFDRGTATIRFYRLWLGANGTPAGLSELPKATLEGQPGEDGPGIFAVTADGTKAAYITATGAKISIANGGYRFSDGPQLREHITLIDLRTGGRRGVDLPQGSAAVQLMWAPDGRHLLFQSPTAQGALRLLDTETGAIRPVSLGAPDAYPMLVFAASEGSIVALVQVGHHDRLVWYSPATESVTHQVDLGVLGDAAGGEEGNDRIAISIGGYVYIVRGTTVQRVHARPVSAPGPRPGSPPPR